MKNANQPEMTALLAAVRTVMTANLTASLDRRAMEGNISSLLFWLRSNPDSPFFEKAGQKRPDDPYASMADEELAQHARDLGVEVPEGFETWKGSQDPHHDPQWREDLTTPTKTLPPTLFTNPSTPPNSHLNIDRNTPQPGWSGKGNLQCPITPRDQTEEGVRAEACPTGLHHFF